MKQILKYGFLIITTLLLFFACSRHDLDKIEFTSDLQAAFLLNSNSEGIEVIEGTELWYSDTIRNDNLLLKLDTFNLAQRDIEKVIPEEVYLTIVNYSDDESLSTANWRFLRSVQLYIYNQTGDDSLLLARLDTVSTSINATITLNPNTESIRQFVIDEESNFKALLEFRDEITRDYIFQLDGINRVEGGIK
ncbi:MAG: hypothetical protein CMO01_18815 [Thalassobius sp.]|nr:hypothetical protein [Thalassovita sp.]